MADITQMAARSGKVIRSNNTIVNEADGINDDGSRRVQLTGSKVALNSSSYDQTLNVPSGGTQSIIITPPVGEIWRIKNLFFDILPPTGASTGTHIVEVSLGTTYNSRRRYLSFISNYDKRVRLQDNVPHTDVSTKAPNDDKMIQTNILSMVATNTLPILIRYTNSTNATQTNPLWIEVVREVEYIVS